MFADVAALAIALVATRVTSRPADARRTFGYYRFEILAAAINALLLFGVAIYILIEAYRRLRQPPEITSIGMLLVAVIGFVVNLISMRLLSAGRESSLNIKGAYLEVWSDMLGSIAVIVGALAIMLTGWTWLDSAVAVAIGLWVLPRTWLLLKQSLNVLLEGVPEGIGVARVTEALKSIQGVVDVHDLHVWSVATNRISLTVHVVADVADAALMHLSKDIRFRMREDFDIHHTTVQLERVPCEQAAEPHDVPKSGGSSAAHTHLH